MGILNYEDVKVSGEYHFLKNFFLKYPSNAVIFDVGANVGNYSKMIRGLSKNAKIYAFEPHPETFEILKEAGRLYHLQIYNLGCGDRDGKFKFYDYMHTEASSHATFVKGVIEQTHKNLSREREAAMVKLDNFVMKELDIKKIDLLKIDAEGNDFIVLKGAEKLIREKRVDIIQFEFNDINVMARVFFKDFYDFLPEYHFYRLLPDGMVNLGEYATQLHEIFAFQNIVAIRKDLNLNK